MREVAALFQISKARHLWLGLILTAATGCGGSAGPDIASVEGTVRLDGRPLANATVTFQPENGRPSFGVTNAEGHYKMTYTQEKSGVMLGSNRIFIRTRMEDESGKVVQQEYLPAKYHDRSDLTAMVENKANQIDFDLSSKK